MTEKLTKSTDFTRKYCQDLLFFKIIILWNEQFNGKKSTVTF